MNGSTNSEHVIQKPNMKAADRHFSSGPRKNFRLIDDWKTFLESRDVPQAVNKRMGQGRSSMALAHYLLFKIKQKQKADIPRRLTYTQLSSVSRNTLRLQQCFLNDENKVLGTLQLANFNLTYKGKWDVFPNPFSLKPISIIQSPTYFPLKTYKTGTTYFSNAGSSFLY